MKRVFISIPEYTPTIEVRCSSESVLQYIYSLFSPYVYWRDNFDSERICIEYYCDFQKRLKVRCQNKCDVVSTSIIDHIEAFMLEELTSINAHTMMLHGGAVAKKGKAILFLGDSSAGKSTLITYLSEKGYTYITDDRIIINTKTRTVIPFTRDIMLREQGKEVLEKMLDHPIKTKTVKHRLLERQAFCPEIVAKERLPVGSIYVINRKENCTCKTMEMSWKSKIKQYIKSSLSMKDAFDFGRINQLCELPVFHLQYTDVKEVYELLEAMK